MNSLLHAVRETYVVPFLNPRRAIVYLAGCLGVFGFNLILIAMPLSYSHANALSLLMFYVGLFAPMGFLFFPVFYTGHSVYDGKAWRTALIVFQLLCFVPLYVSTTSNLLMGTLSGLISTIYWGMYHVAMRTNTTEGKRSYQVVLADNLTMVSAAAAAALSVYFTDRLSKDMILITACLAMLSGNILLACVSRFYYDTKLRTFISKSLLTYSQHKMLIWRILQRSLLVTPDFIMPALMYFLGFSVPAIGTIMVVRLVIQTLLSPLIATLVQKRGINEYVAGFTLCTAGWAVLYLNQHSTLTLLIFLVLNTTGLRITNTSIVVKLYGIGNYSGLLLNEVFLGLSRLAMLGILIPILFWKAEAYIFYMLVLALSMLAMEIRTKGRLPG